MTAMRQSGGRLRGAGLTLASCLLAGVALGEYRPVLHERFEPDPQEDLAFGVRVTTSGLPAALKTKEGVQPLPDPVQPPRAREPAYGESQSQVNAQLRMDGTTSDPGRQSYHEPFRPSVAPFKRTHVYDSVNEQFELVVADGRLRPVQMVAAPLASHDQFFADLVVKAKGEQPVRIASPGPHMTVYGAHLEPESPFGFYVDRAENWFLRAPQATGAARLVMHVGVERAAFDGRIEATSYSELTSELPKFPANVERAAKEQWNELQVSRVLAPADTVERMVTYFRGFSESKERLSVQAGEALYRELVQSRKGVCRHRAYAFMVTALSLGIPTRFVHNEAHAWVEVFGGKLWHRIDLGGAASGIDYQGELPIGKPHAAPSDPYRWPKQSQASQTALPPAGATETSGKANSRSGGDEAAVTRQESVTKRGPAASPPEAKTTKDESPVTGRIEVTLADAGRVKRGQALEVRGAIVSRGDDCAKVRVDLALMRQSAVHAVAVAATDASGQFVARLVVPQDLAVGAYDLSVTSVGTKSCPRAASR